MLDTLLVSTWQYLESFLYLLLPAGCLSGVISTYSVDGAVGEVGNVMRTGGGPVYPVRNKQQILQPFTVTDLGAI